MIYVFGQDLDDYSPGSKLLMQALRRAGFRRSQYEVLDDPRDIRSKGTCYILAFGSNAYSELTGRQGLSAGRGTLHDCQWSKDALVFPTFSPGYLYRNPKVKKTFHNDLQDFYAWIMLDKEGIIV